jgi:hypothetical protein
VAAENLGGALKVPNILETSLKPTILLYGQCLDFAEE